jgi:hypothetical protein
MMQEHRKQASKASAKVEDNWKCSRAHFENVLNLKRESINVISGKIFLFL